MDKLNVLSSVQELLELQDPENPFNSPKDQLNRRKVHLEEEYYKIKTLNRKLWFGLWLYKFMNTRTEGKTEQVSDTSSNKIITIYYIAAGLALLLALVVYAVNSYLSRHKVS
jgi:hypothetical protein